MDIGERLHVHSRSGWRNWLAEHHRDRKDIWPVFFKKNSGVSGLSYGDSVEEALCFGWIDGQMKGIDERSYAIRFCPRRPRSNWTDSNRRLARSLCDRGLMTPAGMEALPADLKTELTPAPE